MEASEKKKLNIWFLSAYDTPEGNSSRTYDYSEELARFGHDVTLFTSSYSHFTHKEILNENEKWREEWFGRVRVVWLKTTPYEGNGLGRAINMISNAYRSFVVGAKMDERPDLIVGPSVPLFTALSAFLLSKLKKCEFIFDVRDIWPQALIDLGVISKNHPMTMIFRLIEIFLYKNAKIIIAVLPFAYKHICKYGILPERVVWIPNGVKLRRYQNIKPYLGGKENELTVMYLGGFSSTHDVETIIDAARILKDETGIRFIIIGGGKGKKKCEEIAQKDSLDNIIFKDSVDKKDIPSVLEDADVLVASVRNTPVYQFGINSNKIFDYLGSGRPIIFAGNTPNDPVSDANAGISIPPENPLAISNALRDFVKMAPQKRCQLGNNGLEYAKQHFDTSVLAKQLEKVLLQSV